MGTQGLSCLSLIVDAMDPSSDELESSSLLYFDVVRVDSLMEVLGVSGLVFGICKLPWPFIAMR